MHSLGDDFEFDLSGSPKVKTNVTNQKLIHDFPYMGIRITCLRNAKFRRYDRLKVDDLEFDLSGSAKVKTNGTNGKPIYDFLCIGIGITRLRCIV